MTVTDLADARRKRRTATWSATTRNHSWDDVEAGHECRHCGLTYHSELDGGVWWKVWAHGERTGRTTKRLGDCPGPDGTPTPALELVTPPAAVEPAAHPCCRCVPPLPACHAPTHLYLAGWLCDAQARALATGGVA